MHLKYYIHTFGCQMNYSDSERFRTIVEAIGYEPTKNWQKADLIIFNTCSVRQKAENRIAGMGKQIVKLKQQNPKLRVVLTGCMARRSWQETDKTVNAAHMRNEDREAELKATLPWLDSVIETKHFNKLPKRLGHEVLECSETILNKVGGAAGYLSFKPKYQSSFQAFVPISTGCDHFCTYCIVPFARGSEVCRSAAPTISEVFKLIQKGYKDIMLLGQTVNRWVNPKFDKELKRGFVANTKISGLNSHPMPEEDLDKWQKFFQTRQRARKTTVAKNKASTLSEDLISSRKLPEPRDFLQLIQVLDQIPGQWWTTWISSHPNYMTEELIKFVGKSAGTGLSSAFTEGHQRPYIHFALQSGSDQILKRMNRRYTYAEFKQTHDLIRKFVPNIVISTDIIVGFPNETEADFQDTVRAMTECAFDIAFLAEYSPRPGTASALLLDDVPAKTKAQRKTYLNDQVLAHTALAHNQAMIGTKQLVLLDNQEAKTKVLTGRSANFKQVRVENLSDKKLIGQFATVTIRTCTPWALTGKAQTPHK